MKDNTTNQAKAASSSQPQGLAIGGPTRKRRWWIPLLIVAVLAISGLVAATVKRDTGPSGPAGGTFTARRSDLTITVNEGGSIRAHKSVEYRCQVESRGVQVSIVEIVPPGTYVTQEDVDNGMVLVKLDSSQLEDQLVAERMELSGDRQNATSEKESYDIQVLQNESDSASSELRVRFALMDLQKYLGTELAAKLTRDVNDAVNLSAYVSPVLAEARQDPNILTGSAAAQELKSLQDRIVLARGDLSTAEATLTGTIRLHDANYVSDLDLQRDQLTKKNREFSLQNAEVNLDLFWRYDFPKNAEQILSDYIEAKRQLDRTYAQCRSRLAQAEARLANAQERFRAQQLRVDELALQIEFCSIKAKAPGLVIYGTGGSGDALRAMRGRGGSGGGGIIAEGEMVYEGQTLLSMPDTASMVAEISVHETEVDKVRPGQPATIIMDAFPDQVLEGRVLEVAPLPDQQRGWMNPDLKVYQTLVSIDGTYDFLKSRMSCKVEILVRRLQNVIVVPIQVVANRRGKKVCYVQTGQGSEEREVQTGAFNDTFVQIVQGLEEGENVLLNPPLFTEAASSSFEGRELPEAFESMILDANSPTGMPPFEGPGAGSTGRRGGGGGRRGQGMRRGDMPDLGSMTEEQRQQWMEQMRDRMGGQGFPDLSSMTEEERQQWMQQMQERRQQRQQRGEEGGPGQGRFGEGQGGFGSGRMGEEGMDPSIRRPRGSRDAENGPAPSPTDESQTQ
ncbi:MAG: HlyD family efflux transporter periplasmic adaptor subunit [Sedimentisphaerales bacterium]|nr:HlyD family efflux transporter periplasmic adaptor subunit [Sedimentisphaerales bacterium]